MDLWLCGPAKPDGKGTHGSCTDDSPCLWNVVTDPQERHEVAASNPAVVASMKARLAELRKGFAPDADFNQTGDFCAAAKANNGFCSPWVQTKTDDDTEASCTSDEDCQLNGICSGGACHCNPGWTGAACALLDRRPPASKAAAAVYGMHPNVVRAAFCYSNIPPRLILSFSPCSSEASRSYRCTDIVGWQRTAGQQDWASPSVRH